jgi:DNA invertase Pin-like site-specific DNA recombinase
MMTGKRAVIWCAVSTKAQVDDKDSLPTQESEARAFCDREGLQVVEVLLVPGHSRRYTDIHELARAMRSQGINAFDRLLDLWDKRGFDVLVCRDGNRFARTQSLFSRVVEETINIGAEIHSLTDGRITVHNYRMWIAMCGYKSASEVDELTRKREIGINKRVLEFGLPTNRTPYGFILVRDPHSGKAIDLIVNEAMRPLFDGLAVCILDGVSWNNLGDEMYKRYGHLNPKTGRPEAGGWVYHEVYNPFWWGNVARHFTGKIGPWAFDPTCEPPEGVTVKYGTHEPIWTGDLAEQIKAELRRRDSIIQGRRTAGSNYLFTGLLKCDECGASLSIGHHKSVDPMRANYACYAKYRVLQTIPAGCQQRKRITIAEVHAVVNAILEALIEHGDLPGLDNAQDVIDDKPILEQIAVQERVIRNLITLRAADLDLAYLHDAELDTAKGKLTALKSALTRAKKSGEIVLIDENRQRFIDQYKGGKLPQFWQLKPVEINRTLHQIFGELHLYVRDGEIVDTR